MPSEPVLSENYEALDYVYCGRRLLANGKLSVAVRPISPSGELMRELHFSHSRKNEKTIGGVYSGALFSESSVQGLGNVQYSRRWQDKEDLIDWQSRDGEAECRIRASKLEADAKKISEIEHGMLFLRRQYENYRKQRDHAGMAALEGAVVRALRCAPRTTELKLD